MQKKKARKGFLATLREVDPLNKSILQAKTGINSLQKSVGDPVGDPVGDKKSKPPEKTKIQDKTLKIQSKSVGDPVDQSVGQSVGDSVGDSIGEKPTSPIESPTRSPSEPHTGSPTEIKKKKPRAKKKVSLKIIKTSSTQSPIGSSTQSPSDSSTESPTEKEAPLPTLVENDVILFTCLKSIDGRTTTLTRIAKQAGISVNTLKSALKRLRNKGFIKQYEGLKNEGGQIGFSCKTKEISYRLRGNKDKIKKKIDKIKLSDLPIINDLLDDPLNHPLDHPVDHLLLSSSSSFNKKKTTTKDIEEILNEYPELGYWRQKKLRLPQVKRWMNDTGMNMDDMIQSLCHCRFEMVDLNIEKSKPVKDVFAWFWKRIEKNSFYHAPKGYKSFEDQALEREKQRLKEKEKRAQELEKTRKDMDEAERKIEFEKMLADPECEMYTNCFESLNDIQKKRKGRLFEMAMRSVFDRLKDGMEINGNPDEE